MPGLWYNSASRFSVCNFNSHTYRHVNLGALKISDLEVSLRGKWTFNPLGENYV